MTRSVHRTATIHLRAHRLAALLSAVGALTLAGCVERRVVITSDPSEALVFLNDVEVGRTPCEVDFTYFGTYDVRLAKPGFEALITEAEAEAPLHEQPGIDLIAMAIPTRKRTIIEWHFVLEPEVQDSAALLHRAKELRSTYAEDPAPTP